MSVYHPGRGQRGAIALPSDQRPETSSHAPCSAACVLPRPSCLAVLGVKAKPLRYAALRGEALTPARGEGDLLSQICRASICVAANIAEGAERGSDREFSKYLRIADGSNAGTQALVIIAGDAGGSALIRSMASSRRRPGSAG